MPSAVGSAAGCNSSRNSRPGSLEIGSTKPTPSSSSSVGISTTRPAISWSCCVCELSRLVVCVTIGVARFLPLPAIIPAWPEVRKGYKD